MRPRRESARSLLRAVPFLVGVPALLAVLPACTATVEPTPTTVSIAPTESTGTLIVDWTIGAGTDPNECRVAAAASIEIHIVHVNAGDAGTYEQSCDAFSTSITLPPGTYQASALLIDAGGQGRTTEVQLQTFTILGADLVTIPIDFPTDSFF